MTSSTVLPECLNVASKAGLEQCGDAMFQLASRLYPIPRSITGDGVRTSLKILQEYLPLTLHEVPTGTEVFDWTIPQEWNIRGGWLRDPSGKKIVDFADHNLHILNYSIPMSGRFSLEELRPHLFSLPDQPDLIPYRTSYYNRNWGFCIPHSLYERLPEGEYEVFIDSSLEDGHLTYGEFLLPGETEEEVLISSHCCHPSLANDNLSGVVIAAMLAQLLSARPKRRYSYRWVMAPTTIGAITWLARNEHRVSNIRHGLILSCAGDGGSITYKKSRRSDTEIDRAFAHVLHHSGEPHRILEFSAWGYDERQYCSPGFNLPVGCLLRTPNSQYPEYHTSGDNLDFLKPWALADTLIKTLSVIDILEGNETMVNQKPKCEPRLGKRGLYRGMGGGSSQEMALLWVLNQSDGQHSLLDIAEKADLPFAEIRRAADALAGTDLLRSS